VAVGLVKSIGVSNFSNAQLQDLLTYAKIPPAVNQIETQPYFTRTPLFDNCLANHCQLMAYSPLGSGQVGPLQDETVAKIAKLHSKTPAQILIRWAIQRPTIVIPKSTNPKRLEENFNVFDFELSQYEMQAINLLDKNLRLVDIANLWNWDPFA